MKGKIYILLLVFVSFTVLPSIINSISNNNNVRISLMNNTSSEEEESHENHRNHKFINFYISGNIKNIIDSFNNKEKHSFKDSASNYKDPYLNLDLMPPEHL